MKRTMYFDLSSPPVAEKQAPSMDYIRKAAVWLQAVRDSQPAQQTELIACGSYIFDPLDILAGDILLKSGQGLMHLDTIRQMRQQYPGVSFIPTQNGPTTEFARVLAANSNHLRERSWAAAQISRDRIWNRLYLTKERLRRAQFRPGSFPAPTLVDVLVFPRTAGHLADLIPVALKLTREHQLQVVFIPPNKFLRSEIQAAGLPVYEHAGSPDEISMPPTTRSTRLDISHPDLVDFTKEELRTLGTIASHSQRTQASILRDLVSKTVGTIKLLNPKFCLVGNHYTMEGRAAIRTASQLNIPSAVIEHGAIFANHPTWSRCPADRIYAWGHPSYRSLLSCDVDAKKILISGAPRMDSLMDKFADSRRQQARDILVAVSGPGDSVSHEQHSAFIRILFEAAKKTPTLNWIVKLHPKDRADYYQDADGQKPENIQIVSASKTKTGRDIFEFLAHSAALVTISSAAGFDAMLVDVPVITVDMSRGGKRVSGLEYLTRGCTYDVDNAMSLAKVAEELSKGLKDPSIMKAGREYINEHYCHLGSATEMIATDINQLLQKPRIE
jgi:hypothetical protein